MIYICVCRQFVSLYILKNFHWAIQKKKIKKNKVLEALPLFNARLA